MKIAHVITRLLRAGSEENTLTVCAGQCAAGHEVFILHGRSVLSDFAKQMAPQATLVEIAAMDRELSPKNDTAAFFQLRAALRNISPDVIHTHQTKAGVLGRLAVPNGMRRNMAIIHGVHILPFLGQTGAKRAFYVAAERLAGRFTDGFIHVSEGMKDACEQWGVGVDKPHRIVHSGFDIGRFSKAEPADDRSSILGLEDPQAKPPVVVMLAAMEARKQHLELLSHLGPLVQRVPGVQVLFAGEGGLAEEIEQRIRSLGLGETVRCLGYRSDPDRILAMADVGVLCSKSEGLPRSVLQYLTSGVVPVAFHVDGIEQVVRDRENGRILRNGDWAGLVDAIASVLTDPELRTEMAHAARDTDLSSWDASFMADRTLDIYNEVLSQKGLNPALQPVS